VRERVREKERDDECDFCVSKVSSHNNNNMKDVNEMIIRQSKPTKPN